MDPRTMAARSVLPMLSVFFASACGGGGGNDALGPGGNTGGGNWNDLSVSDVEPNDYGFLAQELGTITPGTRLKIRGSTDSDDVDLFEIDSWDYQRASISLRPLGGASSDLDLIVIDRIYFDIHVAEFVAVPPPYEETGSFELQPGNQFTLAVLCYGPPCDYELEVEFAPGQGGLAMSPEFADATDVTRVDPKKEAENSRKLAQAFAEPGVFSGEVVGRVHVLSTEEEPIFFLESARFE